MNTQKSAYWVALALFAVALHSEYQRGAFPSLQRAANSASATLCRLTTKAEQTVAMAKLIVGRPTRSTDGLLAGLDARQLMDAKRLAEDRAEIAREEAQDRAETVREEVREQVRDRIRDQVRAQAEIARAQTELERTQLRRIGVLSQSHVHISTAVDRPMISITPNHCAQSTIHVEVPTIDLRMDDSPDNDADSR
ncbi:MAG: hypothetical protein WBV36_05180 [Terriglobales bacterium]